VNRRTRVRYNIIGSEVSSDRSVVSRVGSKVSGIAMSPRALVAELTPSGNDDVETETDGFDHRTSDAWSHL
jgi:hypothetical protein